MVYRVPQPQQSRTTMITSTNLVVRKAEEVAKSQIASYLKSAENKSTGSDKKMYSLSSFVCQKKIQNSFVSSK